MICFGHDSRVRAIGHRLFYQFGLYVITFCSPESDLLKSSYPSVTVRHIKSDSSSSLRSSLPRYSTQRLRYTPHPSRSSSLEFPLESSNPLLVKAYQVTTLIMTCIIRGPGMTPSISAKTLSLEPVVGRRAFSASNAC